MSIYPYITTAISVAIECLILIYYANSVLICKKSKGKSNFLIISGYTVLYLISFLQNSIINILSFIVVNYIILYVGYKNSLSSIVLKTIILTALLMFSELIPTLVFNVTTENISETSAYALSIVEDIIFTVLSRLIYFISIIIFKRISINRAQEFKLKEMLWVSILPISTCAYLSLFNKISLFLSPNEKIMLIIVSILLILSNFIIYIVCDKLLDKNIQIQNLKDIEHKNEIDYNSYKLIKAKYDELRIMVHDFNKYCNNIEALLTDNQSEALSQI